MLSFVFSISNPCSSTAYRNNKTANRRYEIHEVIGQGTFGVVRKCSNKKTKEVFAIKTILKSKVPDVEILKREVSILAQVHHPNIIRLEDVYEDQKYLHLVTELCTGGELYEKICKYAENPDKQRFDEADAARIIGEVLDAIAYCHEVNIVHRDLKAENFLFLNDTEKAPIKIIDFGLSRHTFDVMQSRVGELFVINFTLSFQRKLYVSKFDSDPFPVTVSVVIWFVCQ